MGCTPKTFFKILQLTDIHLVEDIKHLENDTAQFKGLLSAARKIISKERIDFVVITGDIIEKDPTNDGIKIAEVAEKSIQKKNIELFFKELAGFSSEIIPPDRIIIVPGNHEQKHKDILRHFIDTALSYGFKTGTLDATGIFTPCFASFYPEYNITFTIFNSGGKNPSIDKDQLNTIREKLNDPSIRDVPHIAVFHHHLLPIPYGSSYDHSIQEEMIEFASKVLDWLIENGYCVVFHGHKHRSCFSEYKLYASESVNGEDQAQEKGLYLISGGSFFARSRPMDSVDCFTIVEINTNYNVYDPFIRIRKYDKGELYKWKKSDSLSSHVLKNEFEKRVYESETFLSCKLNQESEKWESFIWREIDSNISNMYTTRKGHIKLKNLDEKRSVISKIINAVRISNRKEEMIFSITPVQLSTIYNLGSIFFSTKEGEQIATEEFGGKSPESAFDYYLSYRRAAEAKGRKDYNHFDWANEIISEEVMNSFKDKNIISILEGGFGQLNTTLSIARKFCLPGAGKSIKYFGVDICEKMVSQSKELYKRRKSETVLSYLDYLKPVIDNKLFFCSNLYRSVSAGGILCSSKRKGKFDIGVVSYAFHHIFSPRRIINIIHEGTLPRYFNVNTEPAMLWKCISDGHIFGDIVRTGMGQSLAEFARACYDRHGKNTVRREEIKSCFIDMQEETIKNINSLLEPNGLLFIADPNGFSSSFNRRIIFEDSNIAVSYFNEFVELAALLENNGFQIGKVIKQVRLRDGSITNIPLDFRKITDAENDRFIESCIDIYRHDEQSRKTKDGQQYRPNGSGKDDLPLHLDYEDLHLGYIILAHKVKDMGMIDAPIFANKMDLFE